MHPGRTLPDRGARLVAALCAVAFLAAPVAHFREHLRSEPAVAATHAGTGIVLHDESACPLAVLGLSLHAPRPQRVAESRPVDRMRTPHTPDPRPLTSQTEHRFGRAPPSRTS